MFLWEQSQLQLPAPIPLPPLGNLPVFLPYCSGWESRCLHAPRNSPQYPGYPSIPPGRRPAMARPAERRFLCPPHKPADGEDGDAGNRKGSDKKAFGFQKFLHVAVISFFPLYITYTLLGQGFSTDDQKFLLSALRCPIKRKARKPAKAVKRVVRMNFLDVNSFFIRGKLLS